MMLFTLSDDLVTHCVSFLAAHDLAQCTATSWALRRLAAQDALWRPHWLRLPGSPALVEAPEMPARRLYTVVGLLTSARLQAACAEALRTREKETYNRHRFAAHQLRQTLQLEDAHLFTPRRIHELPSTDIKLSQQQLHEEI